MMGAYYFVCTANLCTAAFIVSLLGQLYLHVCSCTAVVCAQSVCASFDFTVVVSSEITNEILPKISKSSWVFSMLAFTARIMATSPSNLSAQMPVLQRYLNRCRNVLCAATSAACHATSDGPLVARPAAAVG